MSVENRNVAHAAHGLRRLAWLVAIISVAGALAWWWLADLSTIVGENFAAMRPSPQTLVNMRLAGLAIEMAPLAMQLYIARLLHRFADKIEHGEAFDTAPLYRRLGMAAIALGGIEIATGTLARAVLTLIGNPHMLSIGLAMSAGDLYLMLVGAILISTSAIIALAQTAKRENDQFV